MSSPQMASSPGKTMLSNLWKSLRSPERENDERPPLLSTLSSSAVMQTGRLSSPQPPEGLWVINGGKKVLVPQKYADSPIFGVPLHESIKYASVQISLVDSRGQSFVYGHVPVVVAKCSSYLKQNGQTVRGIFRMSGSVRRINVLQSLFNQPPKFGKDVDWSGFTVHDAANILRRYFNTLPERIIPDNFYEAFRKPLEECLPVHDYINYQAEVIKTNIEADKNLIEPVDPPPQELVDQVLGQYERLLFKLPPVNLHLFVYLLDLMDVFESMSEENLMPAFNLATIFLTSLLRWEQTDLESQEYHLSRLVLVFLIENSSLLLTRVRDIAVKEHELRVTSKEAAEADSETPETLTEGTSTSASAAANAVPAAVPTLEVSAPSSSEASLPKSLDGAADADASSSSLEVNKQRNKVPMLSVSESDDPIYHHGRTHSKSMSSANPPATIKSHRDSLITSLRRQLSNSRRRELIGQNSSGSNSSLAAPSQSPPPEDENGRRRSWYLGRKR